MNEKFEELLVVFDGFFLSQVVFMFEVEGMVAGSAAFDLHKIRRAENGSDHT